MEMSEEVLRAEHPDTLTSLANLATTFWKQGRWKEAEELFLQVMEPRKKLRYWCCWINKRMLLSTKTKLGADHPYTTSSLETLKKWEYFRS
jgi:hypothetical protein